MAKAEIVREWLKKAKDGSQFTFPGLAEKLNVATTDISNVCLYAYKEGALTRTVGESKNGKLVYTVDANKIQLYFAKFPKGAKGAKTVVKQKKEIVKGRKRTPLVIEIDKEINYYKQKIQLLEHTRREVFQ